MNIEKINVGQIHELIIHNLNTSKVADEIKVYIQKSFVPRHLFVEAMEKLAHIDELHRSQILEAIEKLEKSEEETRLPIPIGDWNEGYNQALSDLKQELDYDKKKPFYSQREIDALNECAEEANELCGDKQELWGEE